MNLNFENKSLLNTCFSCKESLFKMFIFTEQKITYTITNTINTIDIVNTNTIILIQLNDCYTCYIYWIKKEVKLGLKYNV